jgi:hypothetical protein
VAYTAVGAGVNKTATYSGTLTWGATYTWKVRVSSDSGTNWSPYSGIATFTMDTAGSPTLGAPASNAWLGAPLVVDEFDDITSVTNGTAASASLETGSGLFQTGIGSLKIAITTLPLSTGSATYRTVSKNLSDYGPLTPIQIYSRASSLTNVLYMRLRFTFATATDYAEYNIIPSVINAWEQKTLVRATTTATSGTVNWANVTRVGIVITASSGGSVTGNFYVDDLKFVGTNPSFDGTTYGSDTISTFRILIWSASNGTGAVWDSGDIAGSGTTFSKLYNGTALTLGNTYYWQARYVDVGGPTGSYSALRAFTLNSAPSAPTGLSPSSGTVILDTIPVITSTFTDAEKATKGDAPSYYLAEITRASDSVLAYQLITKTGLTGGTNVIYDGLSGTVKQTGAANPIVMETEYRYRVAYYDSKGARGAWSAYVNFKPSVPPVTTITSPSDGSNVNSPSFDVSWSMSSSGGKGQNAYQVDLIRAADGVRIHTTGQRFSSATSYTIPAGYLVQPKSYYVNVNAWDTDGLIGDDIITVTASWISPDAITDFTVTDDVSQSRNRLQWTASNLTPTDFEKYTIYRMDQSSPEWYLLDEVVSQGLTEYSDFTAANTVEHQYKITQWKKVVGDASLESEDSDIGSASLDTDSWYLIGNDRSPSHIFEIPVISAPFVEPVQQEIFEPLGTSRKVIIRGKVMGAEGTIAGKWSTDMRDDAVLQIGYIKSNAGPHILKSPFGDVWQVEFSGTSKDYENGGHITMSMTWTEVA